MSGSSRRRRRRSDGLFPAYFTRGAGDSVGWPFIAAVVGVIVLSLLAAVVMG